jgi:hypothetical protein
MTSNLFYGVYITTSSTGNRIHHNILINNYAGGKQGYDDVGGNFWNDTTEGNYWSDYHLQSQGCWDNDTNGICDAPYVIDGGAGAKDFYPITTPVVHEFRGDEMILLFMIVSVLLTYLIKRRRGT